jgi:guanylate kinase
VFILPPSFEVLRARLTARATEDMEELKTRLQNSFDEVMQYSKFDYVIINENLTAAARELASIVVSERNRTNRQASAIQGILDSFDASRHLF